MPGSLLALMETIAPPVVAVIVTCNPGEWFEETLRSFAAQDYPELSILVLDAASSYVISMLCVDNNTNRAKPPPKKNFKKKRKTENVYPPPTTHTHTRTRLP